MSEIIVQKDETFLKEFETALNLNQNLTEWELFQLNYEVKKATLAKEFNSLQVLSYLPHMEFLDHQIETATKLV